MKDHIKIAIIVVLGVLCLYLYGSRSAQADRYGDNLKALQGETERLTLANGQLAARKQVLEVTERELRKQIWVKDDSLAMLLKLYRDAKGAVTIRTVYVHDTIYVPLEVENEFGLRNFFQKTPNYVIGGVVGEDFLRIDTLTMPNTVRVVYGVEKGFFKRTLSATVSHSNPLVQTTDITAQIAQERIKRFGIGPFGGIDPTGKPVFGVGVFYALLRF